MTDGPDDTQTIDKTVASDDHESTFVEIGEKLFEWRDYTPIPLILLVLFFATPSTASATLGTLIVVLGELIRFGEENDAIGEKVHRLATALAGARDFAAPYGLRFTHDSEAEGWFEEYLDHYRAAWSLYDDTLPCLDALAERGVRLGIITNGEEHFQLPKLERMGLADRFEHVIASGALGITKPDRKSVV